MKKLIIALTLLFITSSAFSQKRTSTVNSFDGSETIKYSYGMGSYMNLPITFISLIEKSDTTHYVRFLQLNINRNYYISNLNSKPKSFEIMTEDSIYKLPPWHLMLSSVDYQYFSNMYNCYINIPLTNNLFEILKKAKGYRIDNIGEGLSWKNNESNSDKYFKLIDLVSSYETFK
jgi:hypothetical protein